MSGYQTLLCLVFAPNYGNSFYLFALRPPFQSKHHVVKKSDVLFPAHAAFTVLQADELLFHFPAADRADLVAGSHAATAFPYSDHTISGLRVNLQVEQ